MNMPLIDCLKQAREALQSCLRVGELTFRQYIAERNLTAAIDMLEKHEPVAWRVFCADNTWLLTDVKPCNGYLAEPLYTNTEVHTYTGTGDGPPQVSCPEGGMLVVKKVEPADELEKLADAVKDKPWDFAKGIPESDYMARSPRSLRTSYGREVMELQRKILESTDSVKLADTVIRLQKQLTEMTAYTDKRNAQALDLQQQLADMKAYNATRTDELLAATMQLAECERERDKLSATWHDMNDQLVALRARYDEVVAALEKLARLGNEPNYGNSIGNQIAIDALAKLGADKTGITT